MGLGRTLKRSKKGKRAHGKRGRGGTRSSKAGGTLNLTTVGFSDRMTTRLRCGVNIVLNSDAGTAFQTKSSSITNLSECFAQAFNVLPVYNALYQQAMVWNFKYNLSMINNTTGTASWAIQFKDDNIAETDMLKILERPFIKKGTVGLGGAGRRTVTGSISRKKICALKMLHTVNTPYTRFQGQDSEEGKVFLHISMLPFEATKVQFIGYIEVLVTFFNRIGQGN